MRNAMKRLLCGAAAAAVLGLAFAPAQACPGIASAPSTTTVAQPGDAGTTDISSARKKKKKMRASRSKGGGSSAAGTGGGAGGESGSSGATDRAKPRGNPATPAR